MPNIQMHKKGTMPPGNKEEIQFYINEILPQYQAYQKKVFKQQETMLEPSPNHVGMETIRASTHYGKFFVEFASSSTIHGFNHLVAPHRHPIEKFLAVLFIVGALLCLIFLSFYFWDRFQNDATIIVLNNSRATFRIAKPALYFCPNPFIEKQNISSVFKKYGVQRTTESEAFFHFISTVNYENMHLTPNFDAVPSDKWLGILYDLRKEMILENSFTDPNEMWIATERGLCYATRSIFAIYASVEYWMANNWTIFPIPENEPHFNFEADHGNQESIGVKMEVQLGITAPFEMLRYEAVLKHMPIKLLQRATVAMNEIEMSEKVRDLHIHQRKCKFPQDGGLKLWPVYSRSLCVIECRVEVIQRKCNCRPHFIRPIAGIPICNAEQLRCIGAIKKDLFIHEYPPVECNCLPNCETVSYRFKGESTTDLDSTPLNITIFNMAIEFPIVMYTREVMFGFIDFITAVGGAAGLFLGASVLSFIEILYFVTLRICIYIKREKQSNKKQQIIK